MKQALETSYLRLTRSSVTRLILIGLGLVTAIGCSPADWHASPLPVSEIVSLRQGKCGPKTVRFVSQALADLAAREARNMRVCNCLPRTLAQLESDYRPFLHGNLELITLSTPVHFAVPLYPPERFGTSTTHIAFGVRWAGDPSQASSALYLDLLNRKLHTTQYIAFGTRDDPIHLSQSPCPVG